MEPHFIDSNIFLSIVLSDNKKITCEKYLTFESEKFTSMVVKNESNEVIMKLNDLSTDILNRT